MSPNNFGQQPSSRWVSRRQFLKMTSGGVFAYLLLGGCSPPDPRSWPLIQAINEYRGANGLAAITLSYPLNTVASKHVADLNQYDYKSYCPSGNTHSWSNNGGWTGTYGQGASEGMLLLC